MKIGYIESIAGISGDMFLGALLSAGLPAETLVNALESAGIRPEEIRIGSTDRNGIRAVSVEVVPASDRPHLHVEDIRQIMSENSLPEKVRREAVTALEHIVRAESKIHGIPMEKVHLHEISGLDTIVDLLGVSFGIHALDIRKLVCSPLTTGSGTIRMSHGVYPVPAPATLEILRGVPIRQAGLSGERVTPTGAALAVTFADEFGGFPDMSVIATGYGAGARQDGDTPNVLRLIIGETAAPESVERLSVVETCIDDMPAEQIAYTRDRLETQDGVKEVVLIPVVMKKGRSGTMIRILCDTGRVRMAEEILFSETTTLGARHFPVTRTTLAREIISANTPYGTIRIKQSGDTLSPEYEDCRRIASEKRIPLRRVFQAAIDGIRSPEDA
ncbi:nickel pincer cofactor biosynthesis protein LarC [bacterium]|nr:nickel pincer cofactor biosynthesis protein LarC [candidate division CSSED10-310 bacterium]